MVLAPVITSRQNDAVKRARALARGKDVAESGLMLVEGLRLIEESIVDGIRYNQVLVSPHLEGTERGAALRENLMRSGNPVLDATDDVLASISDVAGDQGVAGLAYKRTWKLDDLFPARVNTRFAPTEGRASIASVPLVAVAWGVQDPGNLGTIIRAADAAGATGVITAGNSACPYNPKCIRGTMGSIFRLPLLDAAVAATARAGDSASHESPVKILKELVHRGVTLVATSLTAETRHTDVNLTGPVAIILGGEGAGVPEAVISQCAVTLRIPIKRDVESLNVACAAAIIFYEAARQRGFAGLV